MQENLKEFISKNYTEDDINIIDSLDYKKLSQLHYDYSQKTSTLNVLNIPGYDYSFITNVLASKKILAKLLCCSIPSIHEKLSYLKSNLVKPKIVSNGSCQEIVMTGDDIDLTKLPAVQFSKDDSGSYITSGLVFAKDVENPGFRNVSIHRLEVKNKNKLGIRLENADLLKLQKKANSLDEDLQIAIAIGCHPAELLASVSTLDYGVDEIELAGAIRGEAVEMVKCKTVDIEVPATANIIIEGSIPANVLELEGPFGDFQKFYVDASPNHVVNVSAVTRVQDNPIFTSIRAGSLEDCLLLGLTRENRIYNDLTAAGHIVQGISVSPMVFNCVIKLDTKYNGEAKEVLKIAAESYPWLKYCVAVDTDVDCYDINNVWWAIGTRSNPLDTMVLESDKKFARDPHGVHNGKVLIDATVSVENKNILRIAKP